MCLSTTNPTIKVAEENILVYKRLKFNGLFRRPASIIKGYRYTRLWKQEEYELEALKGPFYPSLVVFEVNRGYHSYRSPLQSHDANAVFIIPKGSGYIEQVTNGLVLEEMVSSSIIYVGKKDKWLTKLLLKILFRSAKSLPGKYYGTMEKKNN